VPADVIVEIGRHLVDGDSWVLVGRVNDRFTEQILDEAVLELGGVEPVCCLLELAARGPLRSFGDLVDTE